MAHIVVSIFFPCALTTSSPKLSKLYLTETPRQAELRGFVAEVRRPQQESDKGGPLNLSPKPCQPERVRMPSAVLRRPEGGLRQSLAMGSLTWGLFQALGIPSMWLWLMLNPKL